jgi:hypothetical protein
MSPDQFTEATFGGQPIVKMDPELYPDAAGMANSYINPLGTEPGIAYVLMLKRDFDKLAIGTNIRASYPLIFTAGQSAFIPALWIVSGVQVSRGPGGDPDSVYMVKLTDRRWFARMSSALKQYNVRCPAPPTLSLTAADVYYLDSLNSGSPWTWELMTRDLWNQIIALGSPISLPYTPDGTPEDWQFLGTSAYDGLGDILERVKCALQFSATENEFDIIRLGQTQPGLALLLLANQSYLQDAAPVDSIVALGAETVKVYFQNRDQHYGTEQSTTRTGLAWTTSAMHVEAVASGLVGPLAGTSVAILDDLPAITDFDGDVLNGSELAARAAERALNYRNDILTSARRARLLYQGIIPQFMPGSEIKSVAWRNYGDGWVTEVFNAPALAGIDPGAGSAEGSAAPNDALAPPDLARSSFPVYPPLLHLCTIDGGSDGVLTAPNAGRLYSAKVNRVDPSADWTTADAYEAGDACWVAVVNLLTGSNNALSRLERGERYFCRLNGTADYGGDVRPLYLLYRPENYVYHVTIPIGPVAPGASTSVTLPDGRTVSATNHTQTTYATSDKATVYWDVVVGTWYLVGAGSDDTPDNMAIVNIYTPTADSEGLWAGKVAVPNVTNDFSTDQFPSTGGDCWIVVLNTVGGSIDTNPATLKVGEHYIGRHFGDYDNGDDTFTPIYAVRIEDELYRATCPSPGVAANASINITLLDGRIVSCLNWSASAIQTADKIHIYHDLEDDTWVIIGPASQQNPVYSATATANIAAGGVGGVTLSDTSTPTGTNWSLDLPIAIGDKVFAAKEATAGTMFLWKSGEKSLEAWHITLAAPFAAGATGSVTLPNAVVVTARNWSDNALVTGDKVVVLQNYPRNDWFLIKSGGDADAIVRPYSASADGSCLWDGKLVALAGGFAGACSAPFVDVADVLLIVMNLETGSWGTHEPLDTAEYYHARKVGSLGGTDVYAIRTNPSATLTRFALTSALRVGVPPGGDNAKILTYQGGDWSTAGNPDIEVWDMTPATFEGPIGARGWAQLSSDSGLYEIVYMEQTARFVGFSLQSGLATGTLLFDAVDGLAPAEPFNLTDAAGLFSQWIEGAHGLAVYDPANEEFVVVQSETQAGFVQGTLSADMDLGAADVSFSVVEHWGTQQDIQAPSGTQTVVQRLYAHATTGADVIASIDALTGDYQPIIVDQQCLIYLALLADDLAQTDPTATLANVTGFTPFPFGTVDPSIAHADNILGFKGKTGDGVICVYNKNTTDIVLVAVTPHPVDIYQGLSTGRCLPAGTVDVQGNGDTVTAKNVGEQIIDDHCRVVVFVDTFSGQYCTFRTGPSLMGHYVPWVAPLATPRLTAMGIWADDAALYSGQPGILVKDMEGANTWSGLYAVNTNAVDLNFAEPNVTVLQDGANIVWATTTGGTPVVGETWGPVPGSGKLVKGAPGFTACGGLGYPGYAAGNPAAFRQETINLLLVQCRGSISEGAEASNYSIMCGNPLAEADGGWTNVPTAINRTGRKLEDGEICYLLKMPSAWHLVLMGWEERIYRTTLAQVLTAGMTVVNIGPVFSLSDKDVYPTPEPTTAGNSLRFTGYNGQKCFIIKDGSGGSLTYEIIAIAPGGDVWPGTVQDSTIDSGASGRVYINGQSEIALNWGDTQLKSGNLVVATHDPINGDWFCWRSGENTLEAWAVTIFVPVPAGFETEITLPNLERVTATNWSKETLNSGDKCVAIGGGAATPDTWYLLKTGGGSDKTAMVRVANAAPLAGCFYRGYLVETSDDLSGGVCSSPFTPLEEVRLCVINSDTGSFSTDPADLTVDEVYIGQLLGFDGEAAVYAIRNESTATRWIRFHLAASLAMTQSNQAGTVDQYWGGPDPGAEVTVWNENGKAGAGHKLFSGPANAVGFATYDKRADKWRIIVLEKSALIVEGTLTNQLSGGSSANATVVHYYQGTDPGAFVTVKDNTPATRFYNAPAGARYRAIWDDVSQQYNLEWVEQKAAFFFGHVQLSFQAGQAGTVAVESVIGGLLPSSPVTVIASTFSGSTNARCLCIYDPSQDVYQFVWVECPPGL